MSTTRPVAGRRAVEVLLETELARAPGCRLVLVDAVWDSADKDTEFTVRVGTGHRRVLVTDQDSPLGIADAWNRHLAQAEDGTGDDSVLVVTGTVPPDQLGWDLRAHAPHRRPLPVNRTEIVAQIFGAADLDPRMLGEHWLLDALLAAEPLDGWPRTSGVLTRDRAVRALLAARLGLGDTEADTLDLDADTLFSWTRGASGPARFAALSEDERRGLGEWLGRAAGEAAPILLTLAAEGRGADALPLGALASAALASSRSEAAVFALGSLFGSALTAFDRLKPFAEAATGVLTRWTAQAEGGGAQADQARHRLLGVLERADRLAAGARLDTLITSDRLLPSGYRGRLRSLATALTEGAHAGSGDAAGDAESALNDLAAHQLAAVYGHSTETAHTAVRLLRRLAVPMPALSHVGQAVQEHLADTGWVDLAVGILAEGDESPDPVIGEAYRRLIRAVRERRSAIDEAFAALLARWTENAAQQADGGALLIEDVLARAAAPLARDGGRPLIVVLDGMSADVAVRLAGELDRRVWTEIVPSPGRGALPARQAAVSMLPSITRVSRASLLCGRASEGGQDAERSGFAAFWRKRHREGRLFHKGSFEGAAGHRLAPEFIEALASDEVVAVVVNTIDDALSRGREGTSGRWGLRDIGKLPDLLNAARDHGRPVLLVSDHGHVIDRTDRGNLPLQVTGVKGTRWRTGTPQDGEVSLSGPRVRTDSGRATLAWRDDIRYTARQAGYHGGASLAEVTVPVTTLIPAEGAVPSGWVLLPSEATEPGWWNSSSGAGTAPWHTRTTDAAALARTPDPGPEKTDSPANAAGRQKAERIPATAASGSPVPVALRAVDVDAAPRPLPRTSLGEHVVRSLPYKAQKEFVRLAPGEKAVAAVLDALLAAGGKLSPGAVAAAAQAATGKSQRNPERFATVLERLLNIDGYPVLRLIESGRTVQLDKALLQEQFLEGGPA
ncbi:BREX-2 system phosphatase PglZ [Streptomyces sp. NBC_01116]|uniref:BREX-2 system phosphatase PglZ n=1 Tax=Streptomyces sp. NBC_01116 TaxID=2903752 RepID=UPI00324F2A56